MDIEHELQERLSQHPDILFAFLFGSQASGSSRPGSDVDVAVYFVERLTPKERFARKVGLSSELEGAGDPDVVVLNDAPPLLGHRALMGNPLLMIDREAYVRYFVRTLAASEDERHWREVHAAERRERLMEGRFGRP